MEWYDADYGNDPSTDNIFGEEMRAERATPPCWNFCAGADAWAILPRAHPKPRPAPG